jgi:hypothetical protein
MKVGLLSYNYIHLKTEQIFQRLLERKFELTFYLLPFKKREKREVFFEHRPNQENSISIELLANSHNIPIKHLQDFRGGFR